MARLNELTITDASSGISRGDFSVTELVADCCAAIKARNHALNAYLDVFEAEALAEAKERDAELKNLHRSPHPLFGIPIAVKDNILIRGKRSTAGSKILESYIASYDATVIEALKTRGAIVLGKTNLDEFAMGSSTENSAFGPSKNPHDVTRVPGGSSGGSAAAVASHLCIAALGSDTGGSIREPASFCGVVGLKPTYGSVSRHGLIAMASSLDQIGPLTKTVEDAAILFQAIAGKDTFDATSEAAEEFDFSREIEPQNIRVGVPKEYFTAGLDKKVATIVQSALAKLERAGAAIREIALPHSRFALPAYYIIAPSEISSNLARFDGIRYGHRTKTAETLFEVFSKTRREGFGAEVKRRIILGTYALSAGYYDAYYLKAQKVRRLVRNDFENAFKDVDVIAGPTTPTPAFRFGERTEDPVQMYLADIYTVAVNLAGLPALSLPAGSVPEGTAALPIGLQLIGPWHREHTLLRIARVVESLLKNA